MMNDDKRPWVDSYVILGSNVDCPFQHIATGIEQIKALPYTQILAISSWYRSPFLGRDDLPDVINVALHLKTGLLAHSLLSLLLEIERTHGRIREEGIKGARTLDCDLLLYGFEEIHTDTLTIPHPEMTRRSFVLIPLLEIAPNAILPNGKKLASFLINSNDTNIEKVENIPIDIEGVRNNFASLFIGKF